MTRPWKPYQSSDKFHEDWTINVASREKCPALGGHVFKATKTILELIQDITGTNLLTKFHDDWKINVTSRVLTRKNAPPSGGHIFQPTGIIFELIQDIIGMNLLTEFHEDRTINVASRLLTRLKNAPPLGGHIFLSHHLYHIRKNAPPPGGHCFQPTSIIFELVQDIIGMNLLTKKNAPPFGSHGFQAILKRKMLTPHNAQRTKGNHKSSP
ncbi:hypothetical protein DPMN_176089 [Dreissena polymorpha]|uniref:Uncharacterized protein n=1 Tax=Dreissena polymorpha TaxID=45954 RepID=A0A9D4E9G7_DREPO|nr:hypothetical protein DPMN_176089 [Dreissena polymorpha]